MKIKMLLLGVLFALASIGIKTASAEVTEVRFYILPIEQIGNSRGPKYLKWRWNPSGIDCAWSLKDYGLINQGIVAANVTTAQHNALTANADVLAIPQNLDSTLNAGAVTAAKNFLETYNIPANWINAGDTYRSVLRTITGMFLYMQRVTAITGQSIDWANISLSTQMRNIPQVWRDAMAQAASESGWDYSMVTGNTTLRQVLKAMADAWGNTPIYFGELATL